jgi:hypothetical protein
MTVFTHPVGSAGSEVWSPGDDRWRSLLSVAGTEPARCIPAPLAPPEGIRP